MTHVRMLQPTNLTEADNTAWDHVAWRRACGWTWGMVLTELRHTAAVCDVRLPQNIDTPEHVIRGYAAVAAVLAEEARS